jgi:hypothetical protein
MSTDYEESIESDMVSLKDEPSAYKRWMTELSLAERDAERWKRDAKTCNDRYALENRETEGRGKYASRFPLMWSNIQTLQPAVYLKAPKPEVSRRFKDKDPVGRLASLGLERCAYFLNDRFQKHQVLKQVRDSYLVVGLGQARSFFDVAFEGDELAYAYPFSKYIHYCDYQESPARNEEEIRWKAFKSYMSRDELRERFGKKAANTSLTNSPKNWDEDRYGSRPPSALKQAEVWELWHLESKMVFWFSPGKPDSFLDIRKNPLGLDKFFPCPKAVKATCSLGSIRPVPDFIYYEDQAKEIDQLTQRICALERMIRFAGVHNAAIAELGRIATESVENRLLAAKNWQFFSEAGGLKGNMDILPIAEMTEVLVQLYSARDAKIQDVYQITGISDIIRGQVNANETATASSGKIQFATLRLQDRQDLIANFGRDLMELELEIASKHLPDDIFSEIAGVSQMEPKDQELWPYALELIRNDLLKDFRLDIETDSTIAMDEESQKQQRIELLNVSGAFIDKVAAASQNMPDMVPIAGEMLSFVMRTFKNGRQLEGVVDSWVDDIKAQIEQAKANPQPPPPDPAMLKVQQDGQKIQMEVRAEMQKATMAEQTKQAEFPVRQLEAEAKRQEMILKQQETQLKMQQVQLQREQIAFEREKLKTDIITTKIESDTDIKKAELGLATATVKANSNGDSETSDKKKLTRILFSDGKEAIMADEPMPTE